MVNLIPIKKVQRKHLRDAVRQALRYGLNTDVIEDFVASIDWSGTNRDRPKIADDLGQLEGLNAEYSERELTKSQYVARLLNFLPAVERNRHLFLDGGKTVITVVRQVAPVVALQILRSGGQPQTAPDAQHHWVTGAPRNDTVLVP